MSSNVFQVLLQTEMEVPVTDSELPETNFLLQLKYT